MASTLLFGVRDFALDVTARAAELSAGASGPTGIERKADDSHVTDVDRRIQRMIRDAVADAYPEHAFLGEEDERGRSAESPARDGPYWWVVDPLDGTRNYVRGFPTYCTSIALMRDEHPLVGVVREHHSGWWCSAIAGEGVLCNGRPARVAGWEPQRDTLIAVPTGRRQPVLPIIQKWCDRYVLRNVGSTALHLAYVAVGAVDAALGCECKLWDIAAGLLMVREAGGRVTDLNGAERTTPNPARYHEQDLPFFAAGAAFDRLFREMTL